MMNYDELCELLTTYTTLEQQAIDVYTDLRGYTEESVHELVYWATGYTSGEQFLDAELKK